MWEMGQHRVTKQSNTDDSFVMTVGLISVVQFLPSRAGAVAGDKQEDL